MIDSNSTPKLEEIADLEMLSQNLWRFAPEVLLREAEESVAQRIPTSIAIGTWNGEKYWLMLQSGLGPYIAKYQKK